MFLPVGEKVSLIKKGLSFKKALGSEIADGVPINHLNNLELSIINS
jgi:hypothetical protein